MHTNIHPSLRIASLILLTTALAACETPDGGLSFDCSAPGNQCIGTGSVTVISEVQNLWAESDAFTIETRFTDSHGETITAESMSKMSASANQVVSSTMGLRFNPGTDISFRIIRTQHNDSTFWTSTTVPNDVRDGATYKFQYVLATDSSTPRCPSGMTTCVFTRWVPDGQYKLASVAAKAMHYGTASAALQKECDQFDPSCNTAPATPNATIQVEVRNDWGEADNFTVEHQYGSTTGALMNAGPVGAMQTVRSANSLTLSEGSTISFRMIRNLHLDSTFWHQTSVPTGLNGQTVVWQFFLATDTSVPACPAGRTTCVYGSWQPGGSYYLF